MYVITVSTSSMNSLSGTDQRQSRPLLHSTSMGCSELTINLGGLLRGGGGVVTGGGTGICKSIMSSRSDSQYMRQHFSLVRERSRSISDDVASI